jgi:hypothetical protein
MTRTRTMGMEATDREDLEGGMRDAGMDIWGIRMGGMEGILIMDMGVDIMMGLEMRKARMVGIRET